MDGTDWVLLDRAADDLLRDGLRVYESHPDIQTGPVTLVLVGMFGPSLRALAAIALPLLILGFARQTGLSPVWSATATWLCLVPWSAVIAAGHADDALATTLLVASTVPVPPLLAGVLVGASCLLKPWAIAGYARIGGDKPLRFAVSAGAVVLAGWLPFLFSGAIEAGTWATTVRDNSPLSLVLTVGEQPPGWWRIAQLVVVAGVAGGVGMWRGPLVGLGVGIVARVLLEPGGFGYYWGSLTVLVACAVAPRFFAPLLAVVGFLAGYLPLAPLTRAVVLGALVLVLCRRPSVLESGLSRAGGGVLPLGLRGRAQP